VWETVVPIVGSYSIAMPSEDVEGLARAVVRCKVCELVKLLLVLVVMSCKSPINAITNPYPIYSHLTRDNTTLNHNKKT
jgi:hypothetical protein